MDAHFKIDVDHTHHIVRMTLAGFFAVGDIERLTVARDRAHATLGCDPHEHATLVDMRDMKIQSQDSVIGFAELLANPKHQSRKLAFVVASSLARAQMKRAATGREAGYFTCSLDALIWLLTEERREVVA
jgi:hypothetical protein